MLPNPIIPLHLQDIINRELEPGERIEWLDMPKPRFFTPASTGAFLFGIPWTAFALFWTAGAAWGVSESDTGPGLFNFFPLFGVPFILVGIGMLSTPIWVYRNARHTVYVITDRRAIIISGSRSITVHSLSPEQLQNISRCERRNGTGDVLFDISQKNSDSQGRSEVVGFMRIVDPQAVEQKLKKLAQVRPAQW